MNESELKALLAAEQASAIGFLGGELSKERRKAMEYYLGKPFGNEIADRSQVVSTDVADTVEWVLPSLMKIFTSGDNVVTAEPVGAEDEESAEQATEYANFVFMKANPGFEILYTMFKDALLQKTGVAKVYWEPKDKFEQKEFIAIPAEQFIVDSAQYQSEGWNLENHTTEAVPGAVPMVPGMEPVLHSGVWTRTVKKGDVCIETVPPEEFLISRNAKDLESASYVAHRCRKTASELIEMGFKKSVVDKIPADAESDTDLERAARWDGVDENAGRGELSTANTAMRPIWVTEAYVRIDWDGDGIAEMRKVTHAGGGTVILDNEEWEGPRPFAAITPILMPHRFYGLSLADTIMDLQLIKSTLWRQMLDNLYLANNGQKVVDPESVEIDDLLISRPGGIIRTKNGARPGDVYLPIEHGNAGQAAFPAIEYLDTVRENRTGVTRYNQGIDANSLNKTATGISQIMNASQQRIELIARIFADGISRIFELIIWNLRRYPDQAKRTVRLRNKEWVQMDPATWGEDYDLTVNVGLGTGNKDQMLQHLMTMLATQKEIIAFQGGAKGPIVTLENVFNTLSKLTENAGFKNVEEFYTDPGKNQMPEEPPKPSPEEQKMQLEMQKAQLDIEHTKAKGDIELSLMQQKAQLEAQIKVAETQQKMQAQGMMSDQQLALKQHQATLAFAAKASGKSAKGIDPESDKEETQVLSEGIAKLGETLAQAIIASQQQTAELIVASNSQVIAAITAPKTMTTPDGRTYTAQTGMVN